MLDISAKNGNDEAKDYLTNFTHDYLGISQLSAEFFNIKKSEEHIGKTKIYFVKDYRKSEKNRDQVINQALQKTDKIQYKFKGKKRHFYK